MEPGADNGAHKDTDGPARTTPDRIVEAGITLFSDPGFKGTTVGEHARRKVPDRAPVLEAAFERHVAEVEALHSAIELMPLGDLRAELTLLARFGMQTLVRERALRRIVITEGDRFPDLKRRYQERVVDRSYEEVIGFISLKVAAGEFPDCDVEAIAVVMVGAMLGYSVEYDVFGRQPAGVDEDRFIGAVVDAAMALAEAPKPKRARI